MYSVAPAHYTDSRERKRKGLVKMITFMVFLAILFLINKVVYWNERKMSDHDSRKTP